MRWVARTNIFKALSERQRGEIHQAEPLKAKYQRSISSYFDSGIVVLLSIVSSWSTFSGRNRLSSRFITLLVGFWNIRLCFFDFGSRRRKRASLRRRHLAWLPRAVQFLVRFWCFRHVDLLLFIMSKKERGERINVWSCGYSTCGELPKSMPTRQWRFA
jgi:hypothetical protein